MKVIMAEQLSKRIEISKETNPHINEVEAKAHTKEHAHIQRIVEHTPALDAEDLISREKLLKAIEQELGDIEADIIDAFKDKEVEAVRTATKAAGSLLEIVKRMVRELPDAFTEVRAHDVSQKGNVTVRAD